MSPAALLLAAVEELTWAEVPVFRTLLRLRGLARGGLPPDSPVLGWFDANGFRRLARSDHEFLVVATEPIGRHSTAGRRRTSPRSGTGPTRAASRSRPSSSSPTEP